MKKIDLRIDVSHAIPFPGRHEIAMTAYLPAAESLRWPTIAVFASPGRGYTRHYIASWSCRVASGASGS